MWSSDVLAVSPPARRIAKAILRPLPFDFLLGINSLELITSVLLPPPIAKQYHMTPTPVGKFLFLVIASLISMVYTALPGSIRYFTQYHHFVSRLEGRKEISWMSRMAERAGSAFVDVVLGSPSQAWDSIFGWSFWLSSVFFIWFIIFLFLFSSIAIFFVFVPNIHCFCLEVFRSSPPPQS